jgi:hypothetical protein
MTITSARRTPGKLIDTRQNLQSIQPTFLETGILFYSTGALNCVLQKLEGTDCRMISPPNHDSLCKGGMSFDRKLKTFTFTTLTCHSSVIIMDPQTVTRLITKDNVIPFLGPVLSFPEPFNPVDVD